MKRTAVILLALCTSMLQSQVKQERKVSEFTAIKASGALQVLVHIGDRESVVFEAEEAVMEHLKAEVSGKKLNLYPSGCVKTSGPMIAHVTLRSLNGIEACGAANVEVMDVVSAASFELEVTGASTLGMELKAGTVTVDAAGASRVKLKGEAAKLRLDASGASSVDADRLSAEEVVVNASGAGNAKVHALKSINAKASGAGHVQYSGEAKEKEFNISSAGRVSKG